jgi:5-methylcytosine-specific restriction protein B
MKNELTFAEAISTYDRGTDAEYVATSETERKQILDLFPRSAWAAMPLEKYALGQAGSENTFCAWLEYRSSHLGSISGGSAKKLLIYKRKTGEGWYFDQGYSSVEQAWEKVREAFVRAFELAEAGDWAAIDQLKPIWAGPALRVKTLHIYFPDRILPVAARPHLLHFLKQLGVQTPEMESAERMTLNQALTKTVF